VPVALKSPDVDRSTAPQAASTPVQSGQRLLEGTVIETVLLNRIDGTFTGPVTVWSRRRCTRRTDRPVVIPLAARVLGSAARCRTGGILGWRSAFIASLCQTGALTASTVQGVGRDRRHRPEGQRRPPLLAGVWRGPCSGGAFRPFAVRFATSLESTNFEIPTDRPPVRAWPRPRDAFSIAI